MSRTFNHTILRIKNADGTFDGLPALRGLDSYELAVQFGFEGTEEEWMESIIGSGWIGSFQELDTKFGTLEDRVDTLEENSELIGDRVTALENSSKLIYSNTSVTTSDFVSDATYGDYPYRAAVVLSGVTSTMIPEVIYSMDQLIGGIFAPVAETYNGGLYIYASEIPAANVVIPTIIIWR